jgi:NADH dehydrogenase
MGRFVGRLLAARARGEAVASGFVYRHQGELATIGRRAAVVKLDGLKLKGVLGWWFWGIAHVWILIGFAAAPSSPSNGCGAT